MKIRRALISVSDKTGIVELAKVAAHPRRRDPLHRRHREAPAAERRRRHRGRRLHRLPRDDGRAREDAASRRSTAASSRGATRTEHVAAMEEHDIPPIDMVVVNLYPFAQTVAKPGVSMEDAIENIDIGGPAMVRAAAKNHAFVAVVTDPADYAGILAKMKAGRRRARAGRSLRARGQGLQPHRRVRRHDLQLAHGARRRRRGARLSRTASTSRCASRSRCATARTRTRRRRSTSSATRRRARSPRFKQLQGKELSYNNIADADAAWECCRTLRRARRA